MTSRTNDSPMHSHLRGQLGGAIANLLRANGMEGTRFPLAGVEPETDPMVAIEILDRTIVEAIAAACEAKIDDVRDALATYYGDPN